MTTQNTNPMLTIRALDFLGLRRAGYEAAHTAAALRALLGEAAAVANCFELETIAAAIISGTL